MVTAKWARLARKYVLYRENVRRVKIVGKFAKLIRRYVNFREMNEQKVIVDEEPA